MTRDPVRRFRAPLIVCFFLSGFAGLLYQIVWLRLAFAAFGIVTPVLSVVLSVFMLGLAVGSWAAGRGVAAWTRSIGRSAILLYAACEAGIGLGAFVVPRLFELGERMLLPLGGTDSFPYLLVSAIVLAISILPWCLLMGATFPLALAFAKELDRARADSFSRLYAANVFGAAIGTAATALVLIEVLGFHRTLLFASTLNFLIVGIAILMERRHPFRQTIGWAVDAETQPAGGGARVRRLPPRRATGAMLILFTTGFCVLGLEVVWTRAFVPVLKTTVYSFALLLFTYLLATYAGSWLYRRQLGRDAVARTASLLAGLALVAPLPIILNDPRLSTHALVVLVSVVPFSLLLGYLTPKLIDQVSEGFPEAAGRAYAVNVLGCILGPLVASYILLPLLGVRHGMVALAAPFPIMVLAWSLGSGSRTVTRWATATPAVAVLGFGAIWSLSFEEGLLRPGAEIRRDHTATVISFGEGIGRDGQRLLVNGVGITHKNPITKIMAHMPLAFHAGEPSSALVICLGMGTTFRSLMSWGVDVTAVELVPSVRDAFPFYFEDAAELMASPRGEIVIDDGRRFLQRTNRTFDVVTIDPPPPVQAAGSSLLYSTEFYRLVKARLRPGGVVQQWYPGSTYFGDRSLEQAIDPAVRGRTPLSAVLRSIQEEFPYVRVYPSFQGWGWHAVMSENPFDEPTVTEFVGRMPPTARADLLEWNAGIDRDLENFVGKVLATDIDIERVVGDDPAPRIDDDRPFNEYFLVRTVLKGGAGPDRLRAESTAAVGEVSAQESAR